VQNADDELVRAQPVCIGSLVWSAGEIGRSIAYRARRSGDKLHVGYFVYWSTERPWGENTMTYTVLPALATDAVYSHALFVLPGVRDLLYGAGDVEGVTIEFDVGQDGRLSVVSAVADDSSHDPVSLTPADLVDGEGRVILFTDVWSHQLGVRGAAAMAAENARRLTCYGYESILPLSGAQAQAFRLGTQSEPRRAKPAWH
jgi:hypothetical protein